MAFDVRYKRNCRTRSSSSTSNQNKEKRIFTCRHNSSQLGMKSQDRLKTLQIKWTSSRHRYDHIKLGQRKVTLRGPKLKKILAMNVIECAQTERASSVLFAPRKYATSRFFADYRKLNAVTIGGSYPLARID